MAIGFARLEFVTRSDGKNACCKAAYNARDRVKFEGTPFGAPNIYDWSNREKPVYHTVALPDHADHSLRSMDVLWNVVEKTEGRKNSQIQLELVLALPDDKMVTTDDRIELVNSFVEDLFIRKGFGAQIDVHQPQKTQPDQEEHNWHAHVLVTTRRFTDDGRNFEKNKPRELIAEVRGGRVVSGVKWERLWVHHQNQFFESKGLPLRVDPNGAVPQIHLGPMRLRGRAYSLLEEQDIHKELNRIDSLDSAQVLARITQHQNIFTEEDVERFLQKYVSQNTLSDARTEFWKQEQIVQLLDQEKGVPQNKFTTKQVLDEEKRILRLSDRIAGKAAFLSSDIDETDPLMARLTVEQKKAFQKLISGRRLSCINGFAGTGKSHLLAALKDHYEANGFVVRGIGPDNVTAKVLESCGFTRVDNVYRFLFKQHHGQEEIKKGGEVWILDEAGKIASQPLLEMIKVAETKKVQLILCGDISQMAPVGRGAMFKIFCERYGAEFLKDVQRQHRPEQREVSKKLASGKVTEITQAVGMIAAAEGFKWSDTKQQALDNLIKQWAVDKVLYPESSSLILAHSNAEVRTLNELVRTYRCGLSELGEREYLCKTAYGSVYVSEGDAIVFRKNDQHVGVTNGLIGTLVKASEKSFVVLVKEGARVREVCFDPVDYPCFQLGYARTFYGSQGKTVDRAYILYSKWMNREMFYVGETRHVRHVSCFVSKEDALCLSDLKRQIIRSSSREVTTQFVTQEELERYRTLEARKSHIEDLKESDSIVSRIKGETLGAWDALQSKASGVVNRIRDRIPDRGFYQGADVHTSDGHVILSDVYKGDFAKEGTTVAPLPELLQPPSPLGDPKESHYPPSRSDHARPALEEAEKALLYSYYREADKASCLQAFTKAQAEDLGKDQRLTTHFREWQEACGKRNGLAYQVAQQFPQSKLNELFSRDSIEILQYRAGRYELSLQKGESSQKLEENLRDNLDSLLFRLFPEGSTRSDRHGYRFGTKGSISVVCNGRKAGSFFNFEKGEGGGLLSLISDTLNLSHESTKAWAKSFLEEGAPLSSPARFPPLSLELRNQDTWVSLQPEIGVPAPKLRDISNKLSQEYTEAARYAYRDPSGNLLFYTLRLVNNQHPFEKIVLPLSYGCYEGGQNHPRWSLKAFQAEKRPLYGLEFLQKEPLYTVLVVEGEKTADAARQLLEKQDTLVLTWSGGSGAVKASDWSPLNYRNVIIWPDNDSPGFKAADVLCSELRQVGVRSLKMVNREVLQREFPEKWDLADALPQARSIQFVRDMILNADEKAVGVDHLLSVLKDGDKLPFVQKLEALEILWRVDQRMRPTLEKEFGGKTWEIRDCILKETMHILSLKGSYIHRMEREGIHAGHTGAYLPALIHRAHTGNNPDSTHINEIKKALCSAVIQRDKVSASERGLYDFVVGRYVGDCLVGKAVPRFSGKETADIKQEMAIIKGRQQMVNETVMSLTGAITFEKMMEYSE